MADVDFFAGKQAHGPATFRGALAPGTENRAADRQTAGIVVCERLVERVGEKLRHAAMGRALTPILGEAAALGEAGRVKETERQADRRERVVMSDRIADQREPGPPVVQPGPPLVRR